MNELSNKKLKDLEIEIKILEKERSEKKVYKSPINKNPVIDNLKSPQHKKKLED